MYVIIISLFANRLNAPHTLTHISEFYVTPHTCIMYVRINATFLGRAVAACVICLRIHAA